MVYLGHVRLVNYTVSSRKVERKWMCKKAVSFSCSFEESGKGEDREVDPLMIDR